MGGRYLKKLRLKYIIEFTGFFILYFFILTPSWNKKGTLKSWWFFSLCFLVSIILQFVVRFINLETPFYFHFFEEFLREEIGRIFRISTGQFQNFQRDYFRIFNGTNSEFSTGQFQNFQRDNFRTFNGTNSEFSTGQFQNFQLDNFRIFNGTISEFSTGQFQNFQSFSDTQLNTISLKKSASKLITFLPESTNYGQKIHPKNEIKICWQFKVLSIF
jgi:hypothetical protein